MAANWPIPAADVGSRKTATRITLGATSFSQLQPFRTNTEFEQDEPGSIAVWPRETSDETGADGVDSVREHDRHTARFCLQGRHCRACGGQQDIWCQRDQFGRIFLTIEI